MTARPPRRSRQEASGAPGRGGRGGLPPLAPPAPSGPAAGAAAPRPAGPGAEGPQAAPDADALAAPIAPGLHFVATPIGHARDITLRALDVLAGAEVLAAEDTRRLRQLMAIHAIPLADRPLLPYHDHNGAEMRPRLLRALAEGRSVAYASDAGTPLVADPGFALARAALAEGHAVHAVPGPSAVLTALTVAGLPTDRFLFAGFLPQARGDRRTLLQGLAPVPATLVLLESPRRVGKLLGELCETLGEGRRAALCRELTKRHEEVLRGTLAELAARVGGQALRGEVVLVVDRAAPEGRAAPVGSAREGEMMAALRTALARLPVKAAAAEVAGRLGLPRRTVYQAALTLGRGDAQADGGGQGGPRPG